MYIYLVIKPAKTLLPSYEWKKDVFGVKTKYGQYNETLKPRKETLRHHEQSHWKQIKKKPRKKRQWQSHYTVQ